MSIFFKPSQAAFFAGIKAIRIVRESTAASMYLGYLRREEEATTLIFDLGGGSLDVSIIESGEGVYEVLSTSGNIHLGGKDFDKRISTWLDFSHLSSSGSHKK